MERQLLAAESKAINLQETNLKTAWRVFLAIMYVLWSIVFLGSVFVVVKDIRLSRASQTVHRKPGRLLRFVIMSLNIVISAARLVFYVDPRGWNGLYPPLAVEMLLRVPYCFELAQWLLIIMRWRDLKMFTGSSGVFLMLRWTPRRWTVITLCVIGGLTIGVVLLTAIGQTGIQTNKLDSGVNMLLGIYAGVFIVSGLYAGTNAMRALTASWAAIKQTNNNNSSNNNNNKNNNHHSENFHRIGTSYQTARTHQILFSVVVATPMALMFIAVSMWRGLATLNTNAFFAYLIIRHTTELVMCMVATYAIKNHANLEDVAKSMRNMSMPIVVVSVRVSERLKEYSRQSSHADSTHSGQHELMPDGPMLRQGSATPDPRRPHSPKPSPTPPIMELPAEADSWAPSQQT